MRGGLLIAIITEKEAIDRNKSGVFSIKRFKSPVDIEDIVWRNISIKVVKADFDNNHSAEVAQRLVKNHLTVCGENISLPLDSEIKPFAPEISFRARLLCDTALALIEKVFSDVKRVTVAVKDDEGHCRELVGRLRRHGVSVLVCSERLDLYRRFALRHDGALRVTNQVRDLKGAPILLTVGDDYIDNNRIQLTELVPHLDTELCDIIPKNVSVTTVVAALFRECPPMPTQRITASSMRLDGLKLNMEQAIASLTSALENRLRSARYNNFLSYDSDFQAVCSDLQIVGNNLQIVGNNLQIVT